MKDTSNSNPVNDAGSYVISTRLAFVTCRVCQLTMGQIDHRVR